VLLPILLRFSGSLWLITLIPIHGHPLRLSAELSFGRRTYRSAACHAASSTALLEREQLLGSEGLVVDLACCLDQVLQVSACEEVSQVHKLAVVLVLDVDDAPPVLTSSNLLAAHDDRLLTANNGKGYHLVDAGVSCALLVIKLLVVVWVHLQVMESELLLNTFLERAALLECKRVGLCNDWHNIDHVGELLEHDDVDWFEGMARRLDEEEAAVDTGILDVALSLGGQLLSKIGRVLVFDVFDNWIPASVVVDQVSVAGRVHNV